MMKTIHWIPFLMLLLIFHLTGTGQIQGKQSQKPIRIDRTESCKTNPDHTYQVFVPPMENMSCEYAVCVVIDPHGDGKLAMTKFREAALKYGVIVAASNLIRNNDPAYFREIEELINDLKSKFKIRNTLFLAGFSGGARMVLDYATNHKVEGVLACGAMMPPGQAGLVKSRTLCLIGKYDFNFNEIVPFVTDPEGIPKGLAVEILNAFHQWPDKKIIQNALGYLLLPVFQGSVLEKEGSVKAFVDGQKDTIHALIQSGEILRAALVARNLSDVPVFESQGAFHNLFKKLTDSAPFLTGITNLKNSLQFESRIREQYYNALLRENTVWWNRELKELNSRMGTEKDEYLRSVYLRIRGFMSIVCYSLCQKAVSAGDIRTLEQVLPVYRLFEPQNPDMLRFTDVLQQMRKAR